MAAIDTEDLISVTEANRLGLSALIRDAEQGRTRIVLRNNRPVAAVVSMQRLEQLDALLDDLLDLTLANARTLTAGPERHSLDEVLARFGYTREQLRELPE